MPYLRPSLDTKFTQNNNLRFKNGTQRTAGVAATPDTAIRSFSVS